MNEIIVAIITGGASTMMELPEIHLSAGTNIIDVDAAVKPSKMSVSFVDNGTIRSNVPR